MSRALKYLLIVVFLIPVENYSQVNSSNDAYKKNSASEGLIPIKNHLRLWFEGEFYSKVNLKSEAKYLEIYYYSSSQYNPPVEIHYDELIEANKGKNIYLAENKPIKCYNHKDSLILEIDTDDWFRFQLHGFSNSDYEIVRIDIPLVYKPNEEGIETIEYIVPVRSEEYIDLESPGRWLFTTTGYIPKIDVSNFTFETQRIKSGVSKQKGVIKIDSELLTGEDDSSDAEISIKSLKIDPNSPDKELFSSFKILDSEYEYEEFNNRIITTGETFNIEFELNTDMATTTGTKFARLVVVSDAAPALESGYPQTIENSYQHEFDGEFYKDNPTALNDGGYIQVEILENPQSSVEELTKKDFKILNSLPILGNELLLELPNYLNKTITLSDIEGNVLRMVEANGSQISIDISELSSGAYFINISDGKSNKTKKILLDR